ncbi:MAG TPA: PhoD-like phosphatase N-terminal domain-containing protein, partial [Opitutus sp.]|nr:PhoD-like phosphatase N-terminal domain-containing protein [Opitutus sp.]
MPNSELLRRAFLARTGGCLALTIATSRFSLAQAPANPFRLGVASGDPLPDGVVLWTRLASDPLNGGGMPAKTVEVDWEIA